MTYLDELLDEAKKTLEIESDYALAKFLGTSPQSVSKWRANSNGLDASNAFLIGEIIGVPGEEIMAKMARTQKEVKRWKKVIEWSKKSAAACVILSCVIMTQGIDFTGDLHEKGIEPSIHYANILLLSCFMMVAGLSCLTSLFYQRSKLNIAV